MSVRIATRREVLVGGSLILVRAASITITRRLIVIRPSLILIARRLVAIVESSVVGRG
jgi:hypothetical protein